jgi:hypothetical protein
VGQSQPKPPISSHGLFPVIVAVWFAALFGLGCLVLTAVLLERVVGVSGIGKLVPAAAPPLGMTARIAMAGVAGVVGALLGFAIARRVAAAQGGAQPAELAPRRQRQAEDASAERVRRPISASEELGHARLDAPVEEPPSATPLVRRRQLALPEEPQPDPFVQIDPLPGQAPPWADEHPLMPSAAALAGKAMQFQGHEDGPFAAEPEIEAVQPLFSEPEPEPEPEPAPYEEIPQGWHEPAVENEAIAEPFAPEPVAAFVAEPAEEPVRSESSPNAKASAPSKAALAGALRALVAGEAAPAHKVGGPLEHLGMAELAERLARSMQTYDSRQPQSCATPEPASAPVAFTPPPPAIPAALQPFAPELEEFDEDDADEDDFGFPFGAGGAEEFPIAETMPPTPSEDETDEPAEDADPAAYGSLLAMAGTPRPFDAPAGAEPKPRLDRAETEQALRSALATLQRMSGAA